MLLHAFWKPLFLTKDNLSILFICTAEPFVFFWLILVDELPTSLQVGFKSQPLSFMQKKKKKTKNKEIAGIWFSHVKIYVSCDNI